MNFIPKVCFSLLFYLYTIDVAVYAQPIHRLKDSKNAPYSVHQRDLKHRYQYGCPLYNQRHSFVYHPYHHYPIIKCKRWGESTYHEDENFDCFETLQELDSKHYALVHYFDQGINTNKGLIYDKEEQGTEESEENLSHKESNEELCDIFQSNLPEIDRFSPLLGIGDCRSLNFSPLELENMDELGETGEEDVERTNPAPPFIPNNRDVLCCSNTSRSGGHAGNIAFAALVNSKAYAYVIAKLTDDSQSMEDIIAHINTYFTTDLESGFVYENETNGSWYRIPQTEAKNKIQIILDAFYNNLLAAFEEKSKKRESK